MENIIDIVKISETYKEVILQMGLKVSGTNYKKIKKLITDMEIDNSHFLNRSEFLKKYNSSIKPRIPINELLVENSNYGRASIKKRLIRENLLEYKCEMCSNDGNWYGKKFSLILDHKNGIYNDNRLSNLRLLCPNCNATLDTHCGKNIKNKKVKKDPIILDINFHINKNKHLRKIERPDKDTLINDINNLGYSGTGRKYGVSDNAIRKWVRMFEKILNNDSIIQRLE
jgi:5-methylcytosine-specific restriction endonuclease McrA